MNRTDFINLIRTKEPISRQMTSEVSDLISLFPYFQSAHLLLLKALKESNDVKFETQLKNSALYIADREVLYYYLNSPVQIKKESEEKREVIFSVPPEQETAKQEVDMHQTVIDQARNSEELITEIDNDAQLSVSADNNHTQTDVKVHPVLSSLDASDDEPSAMVLIIEDEDTSTEEKIFFMDPGFSVPDKADLLELDLSDGIEERFPEAEKKSEENSGVVDRKQIQADLIDKFIIANPRIEPNKDKNAPVGEDLSKPFTEGDGGFVTETLAKIYVGQGYYSRAIDIYEKLSLKYPEKSSYFATQIEKVKEYLKN